MKKLLSFFLFLNLSLQLFAGDTITVRSHDNVHMNWYGDYDQWAMFPVDTNSYERIWLIYTIGCPSGGCSDWDYTTKIFIRHRTGTIDSTLVQSPTFTVNGNTIDTINFSTGTTYVYSYNSTTQSTDSSPAATINIVLFQDSTTPTIPTDTLVVWTANYYNYLFDSLGNIYDSVFVSADSTMILSYYSYYNVFDVIDEFEIARVITPYGGNLTSAWTFPYKFDITDYSSLLKDSVQIRAFFDGWSDGFNVTLDFIFVKGTPAREAYKVVNLWNGGFPYGDPNNPIENYLTPKNVPMDALASSAKLKILQTGHGFGGNEDCAEFCPKYNFVNINGSQQFSNLIWKDDCGLNALYPQPGTWLYDRANWCPGSLVKFFEHELFPIVNAGQTPTIDIDMMPFTNSGNNNCSYHFSSQIVFYKNMNFTNEVSLEEIVSPNNYKPFGRLNPICGNPKIAVKNNGAAPLTSMIISYGVVGGNTQIIGWGGNIPPLKTQEITLGASDWTNPNQQNIFEVSLSLPNGVADENSANNILQSTYATAANYPNDFVVTFKTNNAASENEYFIKNTQGNIIFSKSGLLNNTTYRDTLHLPDGCYTFEITDSGKDGVKYLWNNAGTGYVRFYRTNINQQLKNFEPDFGTSIVHQFTTSYPLNVEENFVESPDVLIYPNPANDVLNVEFISSEKENEINILNSIGEVIFQSKISNPKSEIDMSRFENGLYFVVVISDGKTKREKIVLMK